MSEYRTEKLHILAVLEDGSPKTSSEIGMKLAENFDLKPSLNALRKNLQRCCKQKIIFQERIGHKLVYRISEKGRNRLRIIRAPREEEFRKWLNDLGRNDETEKLPDLQEKNRKKCLLKRMVETASSLRLCDAVLSGSRDKNTLALAEITKVYWQQKYLELIPYLSEEIVKSIEYISENLAKLIWKAR